MGKNSLRQIIKQETRWNDDSAKKHKHVYDIEACVRLRRKNSVTYHHVNRCRYCDSFITIPRTGSITGLLHEKMIGVPLVKLYKGNTFLGFDGAILDSEV